MPDKPNYRDLLDRRVESGARQIIRVQVCLDPERLADLEDARAVALARPAGKYGGAPDDAAQSRLASLEEEVRAATIVVTLRTPTVGELVPPAGADAETAGELWVRVLGSGFCRAEDLDGQPVDLSREDWQRLLPHVPATELQQWNKRLEAAGRQLDFPTRAK